MFAHIHNNAVHLTVSQPLTKHQLRNRNAIAASLSFRKDSYFFSDAYQRGVWTGYYHLYRKQSKDNIPGNGDWFSVGCLPRVYNSLIRIGFEFKDCRDIPYFSLNPDLESYRSLREYQREAVGAMLTRQCGTFYLPRGIIHLPPRTGKTRIAVAYAAQMLYNLPEYTFLFVVERIDLARQSVKAFREFMDIPIGLVGDGECNIGQITIATIQSLHQAFNLSYAPSKKAEYEKKLLDKTPVINFVSNCNAMLIDECHHVVSNSHKSLLRKAHNAWAVFGLSGTPWTDDGSDILLEDAIGTVIYKKSYKYMLTREYLVPLRVCFYKLPPILCYSGNYQAVYKAAVVDNIVKEYVIVSVAREFMQKGKSVAILVTQVSHAKRLAGAIGGAVLLTGKERGLVREQVYRKLNDKKILCIVSTVFSEGIDVPSLDVGINADGGADSRRMMQRLRMQTPYPGKKIGYYIDFIHQEKHLKRHSQERLDAYKSTAGFEVEVRDYEDILRMKFINRVAFV